MKNQINLSIYLFILVALPCIVRIIYSCKSNQGMLSISWQCLILTGSGKILGQMHSNITFTILFFLLTLSKMPIKKLGSFNDRAPFCIGFFGISSGFYSACWTCLQTISRNKHLKASLSNEFLCVVYKSRFQLLIVWHSIYKLEIRWHCFFGK